MNTKGILYFDVNNEIPVVLDDDKNSRPLEVGDRVEYNVSDGWNGYTSVSAIVTKISDKSITSQGRHGKKSRLNISALPDIELDNIADAENHGFYRYTKKSVYVTDAATVAAITKRNQEQKALSDRLEAERTAASLLGGYAATRSYLVGRTDWEAQAEAADIILARYASEIAVEKARIVAEKVAEIQDKYPVRTIWEITFAGHTKPLGFETEQGALDHVALYAKVYGEERAQFTAPVEKVV